MIIDAHVRLGVQRECSLPPEELLARMDRCGIDRAMVAPSEAQIAYHNRDGNDATTTAAAAAGGRLLAYAVANPWRGRAAVEELDRARDRGAVALAVDSSLQGFDLLDRLVDPLLEFALESAWPVYIRTGTPPGHLPLPTALLANRYPELKVIMGRSGATDFWADAGPALRSAPNLYADTSYAPWDTVLHGFETDPDIGPDRVLFATDAPYAGTASELKRVLDWPLAVAQRAAVLGDTLAGLLGLAASPPTEGT